MRETRAIADVIALPARDPDPVPPTLFGRDYEMGALVTALERGPGTSIVIQGDAGLGKTVLLDVLVARARAAGYAVHAGRGRPLDADRPFAPLLDAFGCERRAADPLRTEIATLAAHAPDPSRVHFAEPTSRRYVVQDLLVELAEDLAAANPVLVVVDDLQWADMATIGALAALARRGRTIGVVVAVAIRPTPRPAEIDLFLADCAEAAVHISLSPLHAADVERLLDDMCEGSVPPALARAAESAGGNPFFVRALAASETGRGGLAGAVASTLAALPPGAAAAAHAAAVLGSPLRIGDLGAMTGQADPGDLVDALTRAGVLSLARTDLVFRHELVRDAIYEQLASPIAAALHRQAARALAARQASAVEIAFHVERGAEPGDLDAAGQLRAAATELLVHDPGRSIELLDLALALTGDAAPDLSSRLLLDKATAQRWANDTVAAATTAEAGLSLASDDALRADLALAVASAWGQHGDLAKTRAAFDRVLALPGVDEPTRAWVLATEASICLWSLDLAGARALAVEAEAAAALAGLPGARAHAWSVLSLVAGFEADFSTQLELARRAHDAGPFGPELWQPNTRLYLGLALVNADDLVGAAQTLALGLAGAEYAGDRWTEGRYHAALSITHFLAGDFDAAGAEADGAGELADDRNIVTGAVLAPAISGLCRLRQGDTAGARERLDQALAAMADPTADLAGVPFALLLQAMVTADTGDAPGAAAQALDLLALFGPTCPMLEVWFAVPIVRLLGAGAPDRLGEFAARLDGYAAASSAAAATAAVRFARAVLTGGDDDAAAAVACARTSVRRGDAQVVLDTFDAFDRPAPDPDPAGGRWSAITPAERDVLALVVEGHRNREIARQLFVSTRTVESHVSNALRKLGLTSRVALATEARRHGIGGARRG